MTDSSPRPTNSNDSLIAEQAMVWFARMRADAVSAEEQVQFSDWYGADAAHRNAYDEISAFWNDADFTRILTTIPLSIESNASRPPKPRMKHPRFAGLALAAGLACAAVIYRPNLSCLQADYCTGIGEMRQLRLADGSEVTLNSDTAISITLGNGRRHVHLAYGEAFFDVFRDPRQPFLVDGRHSSTRVLGTRFIVRDDRQTDTVTVMSGVVEVSHGQQIPTVLKANDSITVGAAHNDDLRRVASASIGAWLKGSVTFDNAPLDDVVAELGRYRRGGIVIKDEALKSLRVSGRFDISDTDKALAALQQTLPIKIYHFTSLLVVIG